MKTVVPPQPFPNRKHTHFDIHLHLRKLHRRRNEFPATISPIFPVTTITISFVINTTDPKRRKGRFMVRIRGLRSSLWWGRYVFTYCWECDFCRFLFFPHESWSTSLNFGQTFPLLISETPTHSTKLQNSFRKMIWSSFLIRTNSNSQKVAKHKPHNQRRNTTDTSRRLTCNGRREDGFECLGVEELLKKRNLSFSLLAYSELNRLWHDIIDVSLDPLKFTGRPAKRIRLGGG